MHDKHEMCLLGIKPVLDMHNLQNSSFRFNMTTFKKTARVLLNFALFVLQVAYSRRDYVFKFARKVLALPFCYLSTSGLLLMAYELKPMANKSQASFTMLKTFGY